VEWSGVEQGGAGGTTWVLRRWVLRRWLVRFCVGAPLASSFMLPQLLPQLLPRLLPQLLPLSPAPLPGDPCCRRW
jgi:hypothetical protein